MKNFFQQAIGITAALFIMQTAGAQSGFNQNASRSNHTYPAAKPNKKSLDGQNNNTIRSNRGDAFVIIANLDGDGAYETAFPGAAIDLPVLKHIAFVIIDLVEAKSISNVLKTRHDTVKNSIGNIR